MLLSATGRKRHVDLLTSVEMIQIHIPRSRSFFSEVQFASKTQSTLKPNTSNISSCQGTLSGACDSALPPCTVALAFLTAHGLVRLAKWLHQEWQQGAARRLRVVTCVEHLWRNSTTTAAGKKDDDNDDDHVYYY